ADERRGIEVRRVAEDDRTPLGSSRPGGECCAGRVKRLRDGIGSYGELDGACFWARDRQAERGRSAGVFLELARRCAVTQVADRTELEVDGGEGLGDGLER